ncbi:MAG: peptidoglycan-binding protein [Chthoniobacter sp.]|nr:peptidoglycan-binding protein [Chthoniobacter sp.]
MKHLTSFPAIAIAGLLLAAPATGFSKDKHHDHGHHDVHSYRSPGFIYHGSPHYYHSRPSVSLGFYSTPFYYGSGYYYDSYPRTYTRTYYRSVPSSSYRESYSDDLAVDVQRRLARRGYYRGEIDGDVGPGTRAAIRSFQYSRGMTVTGRIDSALLRELGLS